MPQPIAQLEEPHPILAGHDVAVLVEVGKIRDPRPEPLVFAFSDMPRRIVIFELPEMARKGDLLLVGEVLVAKDEQGIFVHAGFDRIDLARAERLAAIDTRNLSGKYRVEWTDRYGHFYNLPNFGRLLSLLPPRAAATPRASAGRRAPTSGRSPFPANSSSVASAAAASASRRSSLSIS